MDKKTQDAVEALQKDVNFWKQNDNCPGVYGDVMVEKLIKEGHLSYKRKSHELDNKFAGSNFWHYVLEWKFGSVKGMTEVTTYLNDEKDMESAIYRDLIKRFNINDL